MQMSKIKSFFLVLIVAISMSSCTDKSKDLINTWRIESVKPSKPNPQMEAYINTQVEVMKSYERITYHTDGSFTEVQGPRTVQGHWDITKDGKSIYSTDESGRTVRYLVKEISKSKFTYSVLNGATDTLTFSWIPFSASDTLNKKPLPQMQPQSQGGGAPADQQPAGDSSAANAPK
jgi:hypothetical protein